MKKLQCERCEAEFECKDCYSEHVHNCGKCERHQSPFFLPISTWSSGRIILTPTIYSDEYIYEGNNTIYQNI